MVCKKKLLDKNTIWLQLWLQLLKTLCFAAPHVETAKLLWILVTPNECVWFATAAYVCLKEKNWCMTLSDRLTCVCLMWLQTGEIRVIAKSVTVWLQPLLCCDCKNSCKKSMCVIFHPCHSVIATSWFTGLQLLLISILAEKYSGYLGLLKKIQLAKSVWKIRWRVVAN
jgi:hypothetical protein